MRKAVVFCAALLAPVAAFADAPLDVTIRVLESPHELPDAVTKTIELPSAAAAAAREHAQPHLDGANEARTPESRPNALDRAGQARPQGPDFGRSMADDPRNRGNPGNGAGGRPPGRGRP